MKIQETEFFLHKIEQSTYEVSKLFETMYYLSAFLSASKSVVYAMGESMKGVPDFTEWNKQQFKKLQQNDLIKYFLRVRNFSEHAGYYPITYGLPHQDESGRRQTKYYFDQTTSIIKTLIPEEDVLTACKMYFTLLLAFIQDCFKKFGHIIDPVRYFDYSISSAGKSLEDIEEELGFPRGYTSIDGIPYEERVRMLRHEFEKQVSIDYVFERYLETNRFGE
jgi:hypothetical protein